MSGGTSQRIMGPKLMVVLFGISTLSVTVISQKASYMCKKWAEHVIVYERSSAAMPWDEDLVVKNDQCGQIEQPLVVGGKDAKCNEFPHMGLVGYKNDPIRWLCGCTLISDQYVLTAAHCWSPGLRWGRALWVKLGECDLSTEADLARPIKLKIVNAFIHPGYITNLGNHDIAVFKLETKVEFNAYIRPACLAQGRLPSTYQKAIATGWGHTEYGGKQSNMLQKIVLPIIPIEECRKTFGPSPKIPNGLNYNWHLCAGGIIGKDTCQGDSGGPLQIAMNEPYCMYSLVGVTSFGGRCGTGPGVYVNVSYYTPWIETIIWP